MNDKPTAAQQRALVDLLLHKRLRRGFARQDVMDMLEASRLIYWARPDHGPSIYYLTEKGREVALTLADRESVASRKHFQKTGRYLKMSDRPEFGGDAW